MKGTAVNADNRTSGIVAGGSESIKIYVYVFVLASMCIILGFIWDYTWHISIGRDAFFTPPHDVIYFGSVVAGVFSGYQVLQKSFFGTPADKAASVKFWGIFYSSLGGLLCIWGALAMLTSAPFDNWWHNTFGLDVRILSPPHTLLLGGMMTIQLGAYISVVAAGADKNFDARTVKIHNWLFALSAGSFLATLFTLFSDPLDAGRMHSISFYIIASALFPVYLVAISRASKIKWGATVTTAVYMTEVLVLLWFIPLFKAQPRLSPIFNHFDHFQPFKFPLLLIFPAIAIDLILDKLKDKRPVIKVTLASLAFLLVLFLVQYYFGGFYHTSVYSRNWFFGSYSVSFAEPNIRYLFKFDPSYSDTGMRLIKGMLLAAVVAMASGFTGYAWGGWMKRIKR